MLSQHLLTTASHMRCRGVLCCLTLCYGLWAWVGSWRRDVRVHGCAGKHAEKSGQAALLNTADGVGMTAMHWAASQDSGKHLSVLLKFGADPLVVDQEGKMPVHWAVEAPTPVCLQLMLDAAPQLIDAPDAAGRTPLHLAVARGDSTLVQHLLETGCHADAVDGTARSALHWAAASGNSEIVGMLVSFGVDPLLAVRLARRPTYSPFLPPQPQPPNPVCAARFPP